MSLQYRSAPRRQLALGMTGGTASTAVGVGFFSSNSNPPVRWHSWHSSRRGIFQQHLSPPGRWHSWHSSMCVIFKQYLSPPRQVAQLAHQSAWHFPAAPLPPWQVAQVAQQSGWHFPAAPLPPLAGGTGGTAVGVAFSSSSSPPLTGGTGGTAVEVAFSSSTSPPHGRWHSWHSSRRGIFQQHLSLPWQVAQLASCTRDARVSGCLMAPPVKAFTCIVHHKTFTLKYNFMWAAVVAASRFLSQQLLPDHRQEPGRG